MPKVTIEGNGTTETANGRRLVLAIMDAGVDILHRCGGNARCTTCRCEIISGDAGPMTDAETQRLARVEDKTPTTRLSCQVQVRNDVTIKVGRRLSDNPELGDAGPTPIEWPADGPLQPE